MSPSHATGDRIPQPASNDAAAQRLIDVYDAAHVRLVADYEKAVLDPSRARQVARLRELIRTNEAVVDGLVGASRTWLTATLPELHAAGALAASQALGTAFAWTAPHTAAVDVLAQRTWLDVAERLRDMRVDTRAGLRSLIRDASRSALLENRTATQAGVDAARVAADQGLFSVTYRNGARHTARDWADSAVRTTTAEAYNRGSTTQCRTDGIEHVEYLDGPGCCVGPGHSVGPPANGLVVALDDVVYLSHPRCRRSIAPAPNAAPLPNVNRDPGVGRPPAVEPTPPAGRTPRTPRTAGRTPRVPRAAAPTASTGGGPWERQPTMARLNEAFRERWQLDGAGLRRALGFDGLNLDVANATAATFDDLFQRFPVVASHVRLAGSSRFVTKAVGRRAPRMGPRVLGDAQRGLGWVRINSSRGNLEQWAGLVQRSTASGYAAPAGDSVGAIVRHEFGHHFDYLATANDGAGYRRAVADVLHSFTVDGGGTYQSSRAAVVNELSRYATTNSKELAAEAVAEALGSPNPRPMATRLFEVIRRYSEDWRPT